MKTIGFLERVTLEYLEHSHHKVVMRTTDFIALLGRYAEDLPSQSPFACDLTPKALFDAWGGVHVPQRTAR